MSLALSGGPRARARALPIWSVSVNLGLYVRPGITYLLCMMAMSSQWLALGLGSGFSLSHLIAPGSPQFPSECFIMRCRLCWL